MGVKVLTGFVMKNYNLGTSHTIQERSNSEEIIWVIDGLSFVWSLNDKSSSFRGGDYAQIRAEIKRTIEYWRRLKIEPVFVWDGPCGEAKGSTSNQRSQQAIDRAAVIQAALENETTRHSIETAIEDGARIPCLATHAIMTELSNLSVKMYFAQEEADSPTASLAQSLGGFCVANDSDYFIFNTSKNFRGYIPLSTILYSSNHEKPPVISTANSRARVDFSSYSSDALAKDLDLPRRLLPALASLMGNDLVNYGDEISLVPRESNHKHRVHWEDRGRIIATLHQLRHLETITRPQIIEFFKQATKKLFQRKPADPINQVLDSLATSFQSYKVVSHLTEMENFPLNECLSDSQNQLECRALYKKEFYKGKFNVVLSQLLKQGILDPPYVLDDLDKESLSITLGSTLRQWIYSILDNGLTLNKDDTVCEAFRVGDVYSYQDVTVRFLQAKLDTIRSPVDLRNIPILLQSSRTRLDLFFHISTSLSDTITYKQRSALPINSYSTLIVALCYLKAKLPNEWTEERIISASIVAVVLSHGHQTLPSTIKQITKCTGTVRKISFQSIQHSSQLILTLFWITLLAESLLLASIVPLACDFFNGSMLHELLSLSLDDVSRCISCLNEEMEMEVLMILDFVMHS